MNNPLVEKAKYYLNESNRLSEELNTEIEYSAVLEAVLEELVGTEDFLAIMEVYSNPGSITHKRGTGENLPRGDNPGTNNRAQVTKRVVLLGQILKGRQSKPGPVVGENGVRGRQELEDLQDLDRQSVSNAALAFKTHGGQVTAGGELLSSPSNDNTLGIPMKDAKSQGVPVHIDKQTIYSLNPDIAKANKNRLARKSGSSRFALGRLMPGNDPGEENIGQYAQRMNAAAAKKARMAAAQTSAKESGMMSMPEHSNLVKTIMKFLVK